MQVRGREVGLSCKWDEVGEKGQGAWFVHGEEEEGVGVHGRNQQVEGEQA